MYFGYMMEKETKVEAEVVTSFLKLPVYTREGIYVGHVGNIFFDMDEKRISSLLVTNTNPSIVVGTVDVAVPYIWVNALGYIVILSHFPDRVTTKKKQEETEKEDSEIDIVE